MSYFSDKLKELRKNKNLTQKEIAEMLGIKQNSYSDWETGKNEPSLSNVVKLSSILNVTTDELLGQTIYSKLDIIPHPLERIELSNIKNFTKKEYDDLKQAIILQQLNSTMSAYKLKDDLIRENNFDEEERQIINTLFKEIQDFWNS
jgi:transcriptional regulator with XRE-family HTH domain